MDNWSGTCGVTQLPIFKNDKVVAFILKKNENAKNCGGGFYDSDNLYNQILLPFTGEYNGYGGLTNIDFIGDIVFNDFNKYLNQEKYNPKKVKPKNIEELIEKINDDMFPEIGLMLVHEEIYNIFIDEASKRGTFLESKKLPEYFDEMVLGFIKATNSMMKIHSEKELFKNNKDYLLNYSFPCTNNFKINFFLQSIDMLNYKKDIYFKNEEILNKLKEIFIFRQAMIYSRKLWIPQVGLGHQSDEHYLHCLAAKYIINKEQEYHDYYRINFNNYEECKNSLGRVRFVK